MRVFKRNAMSLIRITLGGKNVGIADQASIEPLIGCTNKCVGCYASKTTRTGHRFSNGVALKEFNESEFRKSCVKAKKDGINCVRISKHCDPGHIIARPIVLNILNILKEYEIKAVFVSKSLEFDENMASAFKIGNHLLHISLGMITETKSDEERMEIWQKYKTCGVDSKLRITLDVTKNMPSMFRGLKNEETIITPMRFPSKSIAEKYDATLDTNFLFTHGFYRPQIVHESWSAFPHWCGEVGENVLCCNCLVI